MIYRTILTPQFAYLLMTVFCYRNILTNSDCQALQDYITKLAKWEETWLMKFNASKSQTLRVSSHLQSSQLICNHSLRDYVLESVSSAKYLVLTFTDNLSWGTHIHNVTSKANRTLGFLRRNLTLAHKCTRHVAYKTMVRPQLEFACSIWSPYKEADISENTENSSKVVLSKMAEPESSWGCVRGS